MKEHLISQPSALLLSTNISFLHQWMKWRKKKILNEAKIFFWRVIKEKISKVQKFYWKKNLWLLNGPKKKKVRPICGGWFDLSVTCPKKKIPGSGITPKHRAQFLLRPHKLLELSFNGLGSSIEKFGPGFGLGLGFGPSEILAPRKYLFLVSSWHRWLRK